MVSSDVPDKRKEAVAGDHDRPSDATSIKEAVKPEKLEAWDLQGKAEGERPQPQLSKAEQQRLEEGQKQFFEPGLDERSRLIALRDSYDFIAKERGIGNSRDIVKEGRDLLGLNAYIKLSTALKDIDNGVDKNGSTNNRSVRELYDGLIEVDRLAKAIPPGESAVRLRQRLGGSQSLEALITDLSSQDSLRQEDAVKQLAKLTDHGGGGRESNNFFDRMVAIKKEALIESGLPGLPTLANERSFDSTYQRRQLMPDEQYRTLAALAIDNSVARDILQDVSRSSFSIYDREDPVENSTKLIRQQYPELEEQLERAALAAVLANTRQPLVEMIVTAAKGNPSLKNQLDLIVDSSLVSDNSETKRMGTEMLLASSSQWSSEDFKKALGSIKADQLAAFSQAIDVALSQPNSHMANIMREVRLSELGVNDHSLRSPFALLPSPDEQTQARLQMLLLARQAPQERMSLAETMLGSKARIGIADDTMNPLRLPSLDTAMVAANQLRRQDEAVLSIFDKAFPGEKFRSKSYINGDHENGRFDYLGVALDRGIFNDKTPVDGAVIFDRWGVSREGYRADIEAAREKYGDETLRALDRRLELFNSLPPGLRKELGGQEEKIDCVALAGVVLNQKLGEPGAVGDFLTALPPFEEKVNRALSQSSNTLSLDSEMLESARGEMTTSLRQLGRLTEEGPSVLDLVDHGAKKLEFVNPLAFSSLVSPFIVDRKSGVEIWDGKQSELIGEFQRNRKAVDSKAQEVAQTSVRTAQLDFSANVYAFQELSQTAGNEKRLDYMSMAMLERYGVENVRENAPAVFEHLKDGGFARLQKDGLIARSPEALSLNLERERQSDTTESALNVLESLEVDDSNKLDQSIIRRDALSVLDKDIAVGKASAVAAEFGAELAPFMEMFEAGQKGTKYKDYVETVKDSAKKMEEILAKVSPEEVTNLKQVLEQIEASAKRADDPEARMDLESRAKALHGLLDLVDPESSRHQNFAKLLQDAQSREFNEDTLANWTVENGPAIAAAAAAVALTCATMGAGAPALAVVLASSAACLAATETTKEMLYLTNHYIGDTGLGQLNDRSRGGAWANNNWQNIEGLFTADSYGKSAEHLQKLVSTYATEVAGPMSLEYAQNVVMGVAGLTALRIGQAGMNGVSTQWMRSLVATPQSAAMLQSVQTGESAAASAFARQWLPKMVAETAKETAKETAQEFGQEGAQALAEKALQQAGASGPATSVLVSLTMSLVHGKIGSAHLDGNNRVSIDQRAALRAVEDLKRSGHKVEQLRDGIFHVSTYGNPQSKITLAVKPEGFNHRYASGSAAEGLGPDNTLRRNTALREIVDNFPAEFRANLEAELNRGQKGIDIVNRLTKLGHEECVSSGIHEMLGKRPSIDELTAKIAEVEEGRRNSEPIDSRHSNLAIVEKLLLSDQITFDSALGVPVTAEFYRTVPKEGSFDSGVFVALDEGGFAQPEHIPAMNELEVIPGCAKPFCRDKEGNVWEVKNGVPTFKADMKVVPFEKISSFSRDGEKFLYQPIEELSATVHRSTEQFRSLEAQVQSLPADVLRAKLLELMYQAPEVHLNVDQLAKFNGRQESFLTAFNNPIDAEDSARVGRNCMDCTASVIRSLNEGRIFTAHDIKNLERRDGSGRAIGINRPHDGIDFRDALEQNLPWLVDAAGITNPQFLDVKEMVDHAKATGVSDFAVVVQMNKSALAFEGGHVFYGHVTPQGKLMFYDPQSGVRWSQQSVANSVAYVFPMERKPKEK